MNVGGPTETRPAGGPIFVAGQERSGTSLLYALLGSHSRISMSRRLNWWTFFDGQYGDLANDDDLDRCLAAMMRYRRHLKLEPDRDRLRSDFVSGPRTYGRLLELLARQRADRLGKPRWGDKSLHTERYAQRVFDAFPDATIIHIIRDPRDRFASAMKRWGGGRGDVGVATAIWNRTADIAIANGARFPQRYLAVRYEDLAEGPEQWLRTICEVIGEPYEPVMLEMRGDPEFGEAGNSSYGGARHRRISTSSVGRYREVLADWQVRHIQDRSGTRMEAWGYELDHVEMDPMQRLGYVGLRHPLMLGLEASWRVRERMLDVTGRSPSSHTIVGSSTVTEA